MKKQKWTSFIWQWEEPPGSPIVRAEAWQRGPNVLVRVQETRTWQTIKSCLIPQEMYDSLTSGDWTVKLQAYLKTLAAQTAKAAKSTGPADSEFAKKYPLVYALMTDTDAGDGKKRGLSKVSFWVEPHAFKASISEPDNAMSAYASASSVEGLLEALEGRLTSNEPDVWVKWSGKYQRGKKS